MVSIFRHNKDKESNKLKHSDNDNGHLPHDNAHDQTAMNSLANTSNCGFKRLISSTLVNLLAPSDDILFKLNFLK